MGLLVYIPVVMLCAWSTPADKCAPRTALAAVKGKPYHDEKFCRIAAEFGLELANDKRAGRDGYLKGDCIAEEIQ